jgi:protein CpxP
MKLSKISVIAALAVGSLLACSTLATAQETNTPAPKQGKRGGFSPEQQLSMMKERLNLTDEQVPKVKAVLEAGGKEMAEIRALPQDERREKMQAFREEQSKKLKEILTPDQFTKWQAMRPMGRKGPGGPGGPGGGPDAPKKSDDSSK